MFQLRLGITTGRASLAETLVCPIRRFRTGPPGNMATFLSRPSASASSNSDKSARLFCTRKILFNTRRWQRLPPAPQMLPLQCLQCPVNERFPVGHESCNGYRFGAGHSVVQWRQASCFLGYGVGRVPAHDTGPKQEEETEYETEIMRKSRTSSSPEKKANIFDNKIAFSFFFNKRFPK